MQQLSNILSDASAAIPQEFFHLAVADGAPLYRERVYCYELYHQMRLRWPSDSGLWLNGEVDKRGHPHLAKLDRDGAIPDFLVHEPGDMINHAVIEVKPARFQNDAIRIDLEKLYSFVHGFGYQRAIYLFYGDAPIDLVRRQFDRIKNRAVVEVWLHLEPGQPARCVEILNP